MNIFSCRERGSEFWEQAVKGGQALLVAWIVSLNAFRTLGTPVKLLNMLRQALKAQQKNNKIRTEQKANANTHLRQQL